MDTSRSITPVLQTDYPSRSNSPRLISAVLALFFAAMYFQPVAMAATFNVSDATGLRAALLAAATNGQDDVILLAGGAYATGGTAFAFATNENKTLTLQGANGTTRNQVVLDGGGVSRVLDFGCVGGCGAITLRGLTVQNGNAMDAGGDSGGGLETSANLVISDVVFLGNRAAGGGGAISGGSAVTVTSSTFSNNTAPSGVGGGGAIWGNNGVTVISSTFTNNTARGSGGAIYGAANVTNSTFSNNWTTGNSGGAIHGVGTITNSLFSDNTAGVAGGAMIWDGTITNSLFSNNMAGVVGGAIYGSGIIVNNTFSDNLAGGSGAAIYVSSTSSIINSLFYGHTTPAISAATAYNLYNNFIDTSTGIAGSTPIIVGNVAPGATSPFVAAANGNFRLVAGSPAIDAGLDPNSTTFANLVGSSVADIRQALLSDLQGNSRPSPGTAVDIGTYEFVGDTTSPTVPTGLSATVVSASQIDLTWTASTDNVGVAAYKVYRGGVLIATLGNVTSYSNTGLSVLTTYSYTVQACDVVGNCSGQSTVATATTLGTAVINGSCGAASGVPSAIAPSAGLCSSGIGSAVIGDIAQWAWTCAGSAGGTSVSCSAPRLGGPFAYITHFQSNYVSVINVPTNSVISTITVGQSPEALAIQPDGSEVYVGNFASNNISVIDTATMTQTITTPVGIGPRGLAVAPNGSRLYVANNISDTVSVIDTTNMQVLVTINVGASPWGVVTTPDSGKVYVANQSGNSVSVISAASNTVTETIAVGNSPFGLAITPDGSKVFVANFGSDSVSIINTATDTLVNSVAVDDGPFGVALSPDGSRLYVTTNLDTVSVLNTATNAVVASIPVGNHPQGISVTPGGSEIFVANYVGNTVSVINAATNTVLATIPMADGPVAFGNFITPSSAIGTVVEFYNTNLDHYFITADSSEAAAIDSGSAGPGWSRTGNIFKSGGSTPVCRFYGSLSPGPNSHFYTVFATECATLIQLQSTTPATQKRWNFESLDFLSTVPLISAGGNLYCPGGTVPVYRAYNNGFGRGVDSNHRITTSPIAIQQVIARGWIGEGVVMCAPI